VLATLEAGCSAPVGALADVVSDLTDDGRIVDRVLLRAVVGTADGALVRASATGDLDEVEELGAALAAELLDLAGGGYRSGPDASTPHSVRGGRPAPDQGPAAVREAAPPAPPQIVPSGVDR
jgi:hydroxymethylbilane synthase